MSPDREPTRDAKPRVTGARQLDCLRQELAALLTTWDASTNPVLLSASGQLKKAIAQAEHAAYAVQTDWMQRQYEAELGS